MRKTLYVVLITFFFANQLFAQRSNCPASPEPNTISQPDGSALTLVGLGTEAVHYIETTDGYTVLKNNKTGYFEYAALDDQGNLTLSGTVASDKGTFGKTAGVQHLRYSPSQVSILEQYFEQQNKDALHERFGKSGAKVFAAKGDKKIVALLIEYPDLRATVTPQNLELLLNQPNYGNTGSFRDFYQKASYGQLNLTVDVHGWYMAENGYQYYGQSSSPSYYQATTDLLLRAINAADSAGVDFSQYDNDSDDYVDCVIILHAGIGAEEVNAPNSGNYIWSFRSTLADWATPTIDGKQFRAYCMFPEKRYNSGSMTMVGIGVICHEFGHILDLPDLYSTIYKGEGAGNYTIMAGGPWLNNEKTPCFFDAWSRVALGWVTPTYITSTGTYTIPKALVDSDFTYRINTSRPNEYFMLENRQKKGFDKYLPARGLAIWHINSDRAQKLSENGSNNVNNDTSDLGVGLLQADGLRDLEKGTNRGDAGDLYPGSTNNITATPYTKPNTNFNYKVSGIKQPSNVYITNISQNPDSSITFKFGIQAFAGYTVPKLSGCTPLTLTFTNTSMFASSFVWNFGNGRTDSTSSSPTVVFDSAGNYKVSVTVFDSLGVAVDSMIKTIYVYQAPEASYTWERIGQELHLKNTSTNANYIQWRFNGTTTSSEQEPVQTLPSDSSIFKYYLVAYTSKGCTDTAYGTSSLNDGIADINQNIGNIKAFPNPFNESVNIRFTVQSPETLSIELYNLLGEKISTVGQGKYTAGDHELQINANTVKSNGVYILKFQSGTSSKELRLLKM